MKMEHIPEFDLNNKPATAPSDAAVLHARKAKLEKQLGAEGLSIEEEVRLRRQLHDANELLAEIDKKYAVKPEKAIGGSKQSELNERRGAILAELQVLGAAPSIRKKELEDELDGIYDQLSKLLDTAGDNRDNVRPFNSEEKNTFLEDIRKERERQAIKAAEEDLKKKIEDERAAQALANLTKDKVAKAIKWDESKGLDTI